MRGADREVLYLYYLFPFRVRAPREASQPVGPRPNTKYTVARKIIRVCVCVCVVVRIYERNSRSVLHRLALDTIPRLYLHPRHRDNIDSNCRVCGGPGRVDGEIGSTDRSSLFLEETARAPTCGRDENRREMRIGRGRNERRE